MLIARSSVGRWPARFEAAAGQGDAEALAVMAAAAAGVELRRPAELAGDDDQRFVEQLLLLEIDDQRRQRLCRAPRSARAAAGCRRCERPSRCR